MICKKLPTVLCFSFSLLMMLALSLSLSDFPSCGQFFSTDMYWAIIAVLVCRINTAKFFRVIFF